MEDFNPTKTPGWCSPQVLEHLRSGLHPAPRLFEKPDQAGDGTGLERYASPALRPGAAAIILSAILRARHLASWWARVAVAR